jgi:hypothetical protein
MDVLKTSGFARHGRLENSWIESCDLGQQRTLFTIVILYPVVILYVFYCNIVPYCTILPYCKIAPCCNFEFYCNIVPSCNICNTFRAPFEHPKCLLTY